MYFPKAVISVSEASFLALFHRTFLRSPLSESQEVALLFLRMIVKHCASLSFCL